MSMPPKHHRLSRKEFTNFFTTGRRYHSPTLTLVYTPYHQFHGAVVVGKKVSPKAVVRNRVRRRVYAALYEAYTQQALTGVYILLTKPAAKQLTAGEVRQEVGLLLKRLASGSKPR